MRTYPKCTRLIHLLLCAVLFLGCFPMPILAAEGDRCTVSECTGTYDAEGKCSVCSSPEVLPCEHIWNGGEVTTASSCMEEGITTFTCTVEGCGETRTETTEKISHVFENGICACGEAEFPPCTHIWNSGEVTTASSCTEEGIMTFTCTVDSCGETRTETIEKISHVFENGICTCGTEAPRCTCTVLCTDTANAVCPVCSSKEGICAPVEAEPEAPMPAALYFSDQDMTWGMEVKVIYYDAENNTTEELMSPSVQGFCYSGEVPAGTVSFRFTDGVNQTQTMTVAQVLESGTDMCVIWDGNEEWMEYALWSQAYSPAIAPVAKVGDTEYSTIEAALKNWTDGSTLTLLADVTLRGPIQLKSTEHHILDLDTYTITAARGRNAIEIIYKGQSSEANALTVNAENGGGIQAPGMSCIFYKKTAPIKDQPIIQINGGIFNGRYSLNITSDGRLDCPQVRIYGGIFNGHLKLTKTRLHVYGGTFNCSIQCTGDQYAYRLFAGGSFMSFGIMTGGLESNGRQKLTFGSQRNAFDTGVYVNDNGYLVVGGPVITEPGSAFEARTTYGGWSSHLQYSSAKTYGLYYTSIAQALACNTSSTSTVTVYTDKTLNLTKAFRGTLEMPPSKKSMTVTFPAGTTPRWKVISAITDRNLVYTDSTQNGTVTRIYYVLPEDPYTVEDSVYREGIYYLRGDGPAVITPCEGYSLSLDKDGTFSAPLSVDKTADTLSVSLYLRDSDGFVTPGIPITLKWDNTPPQVRFSLNGRDIADPAQDHFCKNSAQIAVSAGDPGGSGIKVSSYQFTKNSGNPTVFNGKVTLKNPGIYHVSAEVTDHAGNIAALNTGRIIVYHDSVPVNKNVLYVYRENQDKTVPFQLNGNTIASVSCGGSVLLEGADYEISGSSIILKREFLESLSISKTPYTFRVTCNPLGIETDAVSLTATFSVTVSTNSLVNAQVILSDSVIFPGQKIPSVTVKLDGRTLSEDCYTVERTTEDGIIVRVTVTGQGKYKDSAVFRPTYLVVKLPDPDKVEPDNKKALDAYALYSGLNASYKDKELKKALKELHKALTDYKITRGNESIYAHGSHKSVTFIANGYYDKAYDPETGAYGKFTGIEVDGSLLDRQYYSVKAGSTVITLKSAYLETLDNGNHMVRVCYTDGHTGGEDFFRVTYGNGNPFTGDDTHILMYGTAALTSMLCLIAVSLFYPRRKGKYQR